MKITRDAGGSIYSVGEEGGGKVYMSIHDAKLDLSTGIKHASNIFHVMRTIIGTNELLFPFYLVGMKTYGGCDHNHKHVRNKLALFGLFILGNMDKLNVTFGCFGIYFLNKVKRAMDLLNIGLSGLALKSNVQVGDALLMDEVIGNASTMNSARADMKEYYTEIPLAIAVLECSLGRNV